MGGGIGKWDREMGLGAGVRMLGIRERYRAVGRRGAGTCIGNWVVLGGDWAVGLGMFHWKVGIGKSYCDV